jgi:hypothetical protein
MWVAAIEDRDERAGVNEDAAHVPFDGRAQ